MGIDRNRCIAMGALLMASSSLYKSILSQLSLHKQPLLSPHLSSILSPLFSPFKHQHQHHHIITITTTIITHHQLQSHMATCVDITCLTDSSHHNKLSRDPKNTIFYRPSSRTIHTQKSNDHEHDQKENEDHKDVIDVDVWIKMQEEAKRDIEQEPILSSYYNTSILCQDSIESALANHLSIKLSNLSLQSSTLYDVFVKVLQDNQEIIKAVKEDLIAVKERDPACISYVHCFLHFKGFLACQSHRIAHRLWTQGRQVLALIIQNRVSEVFAVDIHPGAKIGKGLLLDHATGVVVGETAVIGDNVSILHNVTLGGTGKVSGDRHPRIGDGVLIGAGTCILGNIRIGDGAKIGAGSVVLKEVPAKTTAVGNPARLIGGKENPIKLDKIPSLTMDHTSHVSDWSDYVI